MKRCPEFPDKTRYPTKKDAETAILMLVSSTELNVELDCYYCDACNGWHLTSKLAEKYDAANF